MIAAVVVTYSAPAGVLDRCLRALITEGGLDRIIVVDTGGHAAFADDIGPVVELTIMENQGYGAAANIGAARAGAADVIVLLNDDVVVQPGWLSPLIEELGDTDRVGAVQPMLVGADHSVVTSLGVQLDRHGAGSDIGDGEPVPDDRAPVDLGIFNGGTVAFARRFLDDTGGFDERYFLYYEDVDLALRGRHRGWSYRLAPASVVEHRRGTSTGSDVAGTRVHQERNRLRIAFRFGSPATVGRAVWLSMRRLRHQPRRAHARALVAGLGRAPQALFERLRDRDRRSTRG